MPAWAVLLHALLQPAGFLTRCQQRCGLVQMTAVHAGLTVSEGYVAPAQKQGIDDQRFVALNGLIATNVSPLRMAAYHLQHGQTGRNCWPPSSIMDPPVAACS